MEMRPLSAAAGAERCVAGLVKFLLGGRLELEFHRTWMEVLLTSGWLSVSEWYGRFASVVNALLLLLLLPAFVPRKLALCRQAEAMRAKSVKVK